MTRYTKQIYPAKVQPLAGANGYPDSGYFAMHITYPDTDYDDDITTWQYAANSNGWKQGLTVLIRTNLATSSAPAEANNVIVVDLKAQDAAGPGNYDLGTEEATRYIAAKINSRKVKQVASGGTRYLRARYVRMSGRPTYSGSGLVAIDDNTLRLKFDGGYRNGYPSDLPLTGTVTVTDTSDSSTATLNYTGISAVRLGPTRIQQYVNTSDSVSDFTITESLQSSLVQLSSTPNNTALANLTFTLSGEPPKHTIVLTWEQRNPSSAGGYWAEANAGPIIQGLGQSVPTWLLAAKPMDGGNMGLPAPGYDSRGSTAAAHSSGHGYVRFSIEGLNSCDLPDIPPPDFTVTSPSLQGVTKSDNDTTGSSNIKMAGLEYGTELPMTSGDKLHTSHGYQATSGTSTNIVKHSLDELTSISYVGDFEDQGLKYDNTKYAPRPIFTAKPLNTESKVRGLQISNENMVFDDLETRDDQGNILTLSGGSPWGVVIRDFKLQNTREDPITGEEVTGPSTTDGKLIPNMEIQLPKPEEIPGGVFVRTGHDRVQAWSNMTWGMGGLAAPDPRKPGIAEASGEASQFDTHDRMLIFHVQRVLHDDLSGKHGLTPHTTPGAVPSGSTRLFSAHRITDHAERGSVLTQSNNGNPTGNAYPHHRIRFGRQGHSYVTPTMHRGTPAAMRRQLHRSHGSAYSLLFEAETEHKHTLFGSGKSTSTSTVFELDTLDTKGQTGYDDSTGSFASDGIPLDEIKGFRLPDVKTTYSSVTPRDDLDYLVAPGQEQTKVSGVGHVVRRGAPSENASFSVAGPTRLTFASALPSADRYNTGSEASINGILLGDYLLGGGTPMAPLIYEGLFSYFVSGREEGVSVPRISTEIATTPPLLCHDPEYMNLGARTEGGGGITPANADLGLITDSNTGTGAKPDAFLCNWLAEYSHPAFFGTVREHFLTFRYRESGMPRSLNYPPVRGLYLRNHSNPTTTAQAENASAIEKLYVGQWLQNYGYNGLNAGGHGNTDGLRSANAVLMGHTTVREAQGTLRLLKQYDNIRYSRGEGIGDGINPERTGATIFYDSDSDSVSFTKYVSVLDSMVAYDMSRRMPIRAYGIRTASDALDMLAGDPNEGTNAQGVYGKGRFDGGIHDSMQKIPNATDHGESWFFDSDYSGVERSVPIGLVRSSHTAESSPYSNIVRRSNLPVESSESPIGIGYTLGLESGGMTLPTSMPAGLWENEYIEAPLKARPHNKGSDPFIDLYQYTGSDSYNQSRSISAVERTNTFGATGTFYHLRGNSLHTNASALDHSAMRPLAAVNGEKKTHYPTTGWGEATYNSSNNATKTVKAIPLSEISDHRQVQSRTEPRIGLIIDTVNERINNKSVEYQVIGTKAISLNSDLGIGQHFPITPSWVSKTKLEKDGFTIDGGAGSTVTHSNEYVAPTWSPDSDDAKGASGNPAEPLIKANTHALDAWAVRGSADLPPWGGVYILRKTYLNRTEEGSMSTSIFGTSGNAMPSHPRRRTVDYIVRPVRPLKLYAFASSLMNDGWTNGPRCASSDSADLGHQPFTRDSRYGLFELNVDEGLGETSFVGSPEGAFTIDFPDANEFDVVYHLIPSASMLQFFKSDAARRSIDGTFNPEIEPRYSQALHPGGAEPVHQSQVRYKIDGSGIGGDFAKHGLEDEVTHVTHKSMMRMYPSFEVKQHYEVSSTTYVVLDDASILPSTGKLFISGVSGALTYSAKSRDKLTLSANAITGYTTLGSLVGQKLHFTDVSVPSSISDFRALTLPYPTIPTLADNSLVMAKIESDGWRRYDSDTDTVKETALSYRGLLEYDPSDFIMLTQQPLKIANGKNIAEIKNINTAIQKIRLDGKEISETYNSPYLIDSNGNRLRIAGAKIESSTTSLVLKNIESDSLFDEGINTDGGVLLGQYGFIGVRTSDAAMMMLNDAGPELTSFNVTPTNALVANDRDVSSTLKAHPSLRIINDHSRTFVARKTRGISILEVMRNLTNLDGRQLVNEKNGGLVYGSTIFNDKGTTIGMGTAAREVGVSRMIDSPNEVVVVGDRIAINEQVYVSINDPERMKTDAGAGATTGLSKTLRQDITGLKTKQEAIKLAKSVLARTENRTPIISIKGALKMTSVSPGEMVTVDLPIHNLRGRFAVFEAEHNFASLESDFVIAQYDKGIEGILSDLRAFASNSEPAEESASDIVDVVEMSTSGSIRIQAVHRVQVRSVNNRGFIIGAKQGKGMGKIGVRTGDKRSLPIGHSKSRYYVVK